ncbi:SGNH/GDSL hydrolase family protein [Streptomyces sp. DSM 44917]|uniref:SGNH/GDSL hydrolase family protein n=1 Tax=Streptomyces boetiae TaxID=3075541 RepID=A0ABU2L8J1_9ACTN|nr:SGNH/GDSL hydrolase family protein [Streptomyces sp. DSM 44917]MDT0307815.1 SGNH/GDSL hydrolase family protein [Streptomyces sp. DSM 44917]
MGVVRVRRGFYALLAGLMAVLVGVVVAIGTGRQGEREVTAAPTAPAEAEEGREDAEPVTPAARSAWVGTWSASPTGAEPATVDGLPDRSLRNVLRASVGGSSVRVELSNRYGTRPVTFTRVTVALSAYGGPAARPDTMRELTFGGGATVIVPAGGSVLSDPVSLKVPTAADVLVTVYAPEPSGPVTYHRMARQTSYAAPGDVAADTTGGPYQETVDSWRYVTALHVLSAQAAGSVVVLGDSLTDGAGSTPGANHRWTDFLAARLRDEPGAPALSVLNQGVSGNRLLVDAAPERPSNGASGLRRLGSDVLQQPRVRTLVIQLGVNDILFEPGHEDPWAVVDGLRRLADEARAAGLHVVGVTLAPFGTHERFSPETERIRQQVNAEIRAGRVFDEVVDFDRALRDPAAPQRLLPAYDSGDGLHPNDAGFQAMAGAVDLGLLMAEPDPTL